jgi:hypothetical protein
MRHLAVCVSVCLYVYPPYRCYVTAPKTCPVATNTRYNRRIVGRVFFYAVHVLSKEIRWVCLCIPYCC